MLTEGVDAGKDFIGTNKDDLFIADNSVTVKTSAADTLDGGKGTEDTFKLYDKAATPITTALLPTLKNIENVVIYDSNATDLNLTKWDSVETLFLVRDASTTTLTGYVLGEKVTTVNVVDTTDSTNTLTLNFDADLTAATLGVNNVIDTTAAPAATAVTTAINGAALKTLTVDASGKASFINLTIPAAIETLDITGKADLELGTGLTNIKTVDGSKAEGNLTLSKLAAMTSVKTGSGNDTVNIATAAAVASGDTINLGAGNDKLVKSVAAGTVAASTTTVIDGGAGIDTLDAALVNVGNAGVFASFETLSLTADSAPASGLDLDLLTKSTITTIALDSTAAITTKLLNVKKSQSLTVNAANAASATTLTFKASEIAGTTDAYTINFDKETTDASGTFNAGTVTITGIETVTVNSLGKTSAATDTNKITLQDAEAKSLVITGDKNIDLVLGTTGAGSITFGTVGTAIDGKGLATIDASASTAGITIANLTNVGEADAGLTIKGGAGVDNINTLNYGKAITIEAGAGNDIITVGATGGTLTGGAGNDKFVVGAATAGTADATTAVITTITDIIKGDIISGVNAGVLLTKGVITGATNLDDAIDKALTGATAANNTWFQYGDDTYLVVDKAAGAGALDADDVIVKLNGLVDLSSSTLGTGAANVELTIA